MRFMSCVFAALLCTTGLSQIDKSNALTLNSLSSAALAEAESQSTLNQDSQQVDVDDNDMDLAVDMDDEDDSAFVDEADLDVSDLQNPDKKKQKKVVKERTIPKRRPVKKYAAVYVTESGQSVTVPVGQNSIAALVKGIERHAEPKLAKIKNKDIAIVNNKLKICNVKDTLVGGCIAKNGERVTAWALQATPAPEFDHKLVQPVKGDWFSIRNGHSIQHLEYKPNENVQNVKEEIGRLLRGRPIHTFHVVNAKTNTICRPKQTLIKCGIHKESILDIQLLDEKYYTAKQEAKDVLLEEDQDDDDDEVDDEVMELIQAQDEELVDEDEVDDEDDSALVEEDALEEVDEDNEDLAEDEDEGTPKDKKKGRKGRKDRGVRLTPAELKKLHLSPNEAKQFAEFLKDRRLHYKQAKHGRKGPAHHPGRKPSKKGKGVRKHKKGSGKPGKRPEHHGQGISPNAAKKLEKLFEEWEAKHKGVRFVEEDEQVFASDE